MTQARRFATPLQLRARSVASLVAALLAAASPGVVAPALAQQGAQAPSSQAPFGQVAPGSAPSGQAAQPSAAQISAAHLDAAREVVALSGIARTFNVMVPQLAEQTLVTITRTRPEVRNDLLAVLSAIRPEFEKRSVLMVDSTARAFAGVMSEQDLKDTAAFFKSGAGQSYVRMQPMVIDQMVVSLDAWNRQMSIDLMTRVREELRKKGHTI